MAVDIVVPAAGESVKEADIANWYKNNGDIVAMDEPLVALETDKATLDLTASVAGVLTITVQDGTVKVGQVIGTISATTEVPVPDSSPAPVVQAESSLDLFDSLPKPSSPPAFPGKGGYASGLPSPAASKLMAEKGLSSDEVVGTGKGGRITKADVVNAEVSFPDLADLSPVTSPLSVEVSVAPEALPSKPVEQVVQSPVIAPVVSAPVSASVLSVTEGGRPERREKMSRLRQTIAKRLVEAQQTAALLTTFNEVDMSAVMEIRKKYKDAFKDKHQVGLGFMSFFAKAAAQALQAFPIMNAGIDGDTVVYRDYCDIGIAVATPKGLVVPILRDVQAMSFKDVESKIVEFGQKGKSGGITLQDMEGGTFTITNGGTFGSMLSTPIVNRPQSAILGMHNIVERPVALNGQVVIRPIMYLAVTYDHRIIDGADAVRFLVHIKQLVEDPTRLLIGL